MYIFQCVVLTLAVFVLVYLCAKQLYQVIRSTVEAEVIEEIQHNLAVDWSIDIEIIDERGQ